MAKFDWPCWPKYQKGEGEKRTSGRIGRKREIVKQMMEHFESGEEFGQERKEMEDMTEKQTGD